MSRGIFPFEDFRNVEISYFGDSSDEEYIGWFNVPVNDIAIMESLQSSKNIVGNLPDKVFCELLSFVPLLLDESLSDELSTARSPPSAYSMRMQRVLPISSKKADL